MLLIPPIPMKAKWFVIIYGVIELFLGWRGVGNVAHFATWAVCSGVSCCSTGGSSAA